jgi:hypothetical protein
VVEIQQRLGVRGLHNTVGQMHKWGVLIAAGETTRKASRYSLAPAWHQDLEEVVRHGMEEAFAGQVLYVFGGGDLASVARRLAGDFRQDVVWVGLMEDGKGLLVGLDSRQGLDSASLLQTFQSQGVECEVTGISSRITGSAATALLQGLAQSTGNKD